MMDVSGARLWKFWLQRRIYAVPAARIMDGVIGD